MVEDLKSYSEQLAKCRKKLAIKELKLPIEGKKISYKFDEGYWSFTIFVDGEKYKKFQTSGGSGFPLRVPIVMYKLYDKSMGSLMIWSHEVSVLRKVGLVSGYGHKGSKNVKLTEIGKKLLKN